MHSSGNPMQHLNRPNSHSRASNLSAGGGNTGSERNFNLNLNSIKSEKKMTKHSSQSRMQQTHGQPSRLFLQSPPTASTTKATPVRKSAGSGLPRGAYAGGSKVPKSSSGHHRRLEQGSNSVRLSQTGVISGSRDFTMAAAGASSQRHGQPQYTSYQLDAVDLLSNRIHKIFREYFSTIKAYADFKEVSCS